jgi:protein ImuB
VAHKHDPVLDAQAIEQLATELQQHISPLVAVESLDAKPWAGQAIHAPDSLLCDITGVAHLFGGEAGLLKAAEEQLQRFGLRARLAIADSVGAAWALAHYRRGQRPKFDSHQDELTALPVEALRIPQTTVDTLTRLGVTRIDELLSLPRSGLATRLGNQLVRRIEQLLGEIEEPIEVHHAAAEQTHSCELEYPTDDCAILADRIAVVTEKVRAGLATRQRGALRIACCLALADHPPLTLEVGFFAPTLDAVHMSGLLVGCIENRHLPSSVTQITLSVALSGPLRSCQNSLFPQTPNAVANRVSNSSLSRMVDALSGRLGRDAVLGVSRSDDPLPEKAYQLTPLTGHADSGKAVAGSRRLPAPSLRSEQARSNTSHSKKHDRSSNNPSSADVVQPSADDALRRPLNLLDPPIPLSPIDRAAVSPDNPLPLGFRLGGKLHRIIRHWGPERIETGWWYGPSIRRDYYRVETDQGNWWWVFRNLTPPSSNSETLRPSWMLHGRFS